MQKQKSIDGINSGRFTQSIRLQHHSLLKAQSPARRAVFLDSAVSQRRKLLQPSVIILKQEPEKAVNRKQFQFSLPKINFSWLDNVVSFAKSRKLKFSPVQLASVAVVGLVAFTGGMITILNISETEAQQEQGQVLGSSTVRVVESPGAHGPVADVPNDVLYNLTIEQLENYLSEALKTDEVREAERLAERKQKLKAYLEFRQSPFVNIVDTIAELKHWKLVLAISNSESSLGKKCHSNNCSGIGVEPGHPLWREYQSTADWAKDLDNLLERRYKDWTLEEMNGVYNQPGSSNWLAASRQVLEQLQERGIE